jgi:hypothetical protein
MIEPIAKPGADRYEDCRHLVFRISPASDSPVPGPYCDSPIGVFPRLDCPVFQGRKCAYFEPRADEEAPSVSSREEIEALGARLAEDYLGWRYWRRIEELSGGPPPPAPE